MTEFEKDPQLEFHTIASRLRAKGTPHSIATVIEVEGSASARPGAKAIFDEEGNNLFGWVGGGGAEEYISEEAVEALHERRQRIVMVELDDEIFGLGIACGGRMRVFIDPQPKAETMILPRLGHLEETAKFMANSYGWNVEWSEQIHHVGGTVDLLMLLASCIARSRNRKPLPLRELTQLPIQFKHFPLAPNRRAVLIGRGRVTEALARHFALLNWEVEVAAPSLMDTEYPSTTILKEGYSNADIRSRDVVIIASHTKRDPEFARAALAANASYVAMIGSRKRAFEVLNYLHLTKGETNLPLFVPAGLDLGAQHPEEIALSVVAEVLNPRGLP